MRIGGAVSWRKDHINSEKRIAEFDIPPKAAIAIGIIINELLTNAFKYAFKNRSKGAVSISIDKNENTVTVAIQDNGTGINAAAIKQKSTGLGLSLVQMLIDQLKGTHATVNENGTKHIIEFEL